MTFQDDVLQGLDVEAGALCESEARRLETGMRRLIFLSGDDPAIVASVLGDLAALVTENGTATAVEIAPILVARMAATMRQAIIAKAKGNLAEWLRQRRGEVESNALAT